MDPLHIIFLILYLINRLVSKDTFFQVCISSLWTYVTFKRNGYAVINIKQQHK